jgi:FADH2 O2-dependent halogenase
MVGVRPYHAYGHSLDAMGLTSPLFHATLHHTFEGGWMWIIPFNNHPRATNPLCSVGLNLDTRVFPKPSCSPEDEWERFLARFPSMRAQFEGAKPVRRWISTDRLQYTTDRCVGDRWALLAHASGAIDALFSRGMFNTTASVHVLADRILKALGEDRFGRDRFLPVEKLIHGFHDVHDRLVSGAYTSFRHFPLWNAWLRVWMATGFLENSRSLRALFRYAETGDPDFLTVAGAPDLMEALPSYRRLVEDGGALCDEVEAGRLRPERATTELFRLLGECDCLPPALDIANPARHAIAPTSVVQLHRMLEWSRSKGAPAFVREQLYDYKLSTVAREVVRWNGLVIEGRRRRVWARTGEVCMA